MHADRGFEPKNPFISSVPRKGRAPRLASNRKMKPRSRTFATQNNPWLQTAKPTYPPCGPRGIEPLGAANTLFARPVQLHHRLNQLRLPRRLRRQLLL